MATERRQPGEEETIEERRNQVWLLRKKGLSTRRIAAALKDTYGVSHVTVGQDINAVLDELHASQLESAEQYRTMELERLDDWAFRVEREVDEGRVKFVDGLDRLLAISKERSKLHGLYKQYNLDFQLMFKIAQTIAIRGGNVRRFFDTMYDKLTSGEEEDMIDIEADEDDV